jgi:hypothetical protein
VSSFQHLPFGDFIAQSEAKREEKGKKVYLCLGPERIETESGKKGRREAKARLRINKK